MQSLLLILAAFCLGKYQKQDRFLTGLLMLFALLVAGEASPFSFYRLFKDVIFYSLGMIGFNLLLEGLQYRLAFSKLPQTVQGLPVFIFLTSLIFLAFRFFLFGR